MNTAPRVVLNNVLRRSYSQAHKGPSAPKPSASGSPAPATSNVTGLTSACVKPTASPVGPGASANGQYKVPEYYCFNRFSFSEAEVEMAKYRCPSHLR